MKRLFLIIAIFVFISCVQQSEIKGLEQIVSSEIKSTLPSTWTYEPIAFSNIDSVMSSIEDLAQYRELLQQQARIDSLYDERESARIAEEISDLKLKFHPYYIGQKILHAYLCTTDFGDSLFIDEFILDKHKNIIKKKSSSIYVQSPDSIRLESTQKQLKHFLDKAVEWK